MLFSRSFSLGFVFMAIYACFGLLAGEAAAQYRVESTPVYQPRKDIQTSQSFYWNGSSHGGVFSDEALTDNGYTQYEQPQYEPAPYGAAPAYGAPAPTYMQDQSQFYYGGAVPPPSIRRLYWVRGPRNAYAQNYNGNYGGTYGASGDYGATCVTSRGACPVQVVPLGTLCRCIIPGIGYRRGQVKY